MYNLYDRKFRETNDLGYAQGYVDGYDAAFTEAIARVVHIWNKSGCEIGNQQNILCKELDKLIEDAT